MCKMQGLIWSSFLPMSKIIPALFICASNSEMNANLTARRRIFDGLKRPSSRYAFVTKSGLEIFYFGEQMLIMFHLWEYFYSIHWMGYNYILKYSTIPVRTKNTFPARSNIQKNFRKNSFLWDWFTERLGDDETVKKCHFTMADPISCLAHTHTNLLR